MQNLKELGLKVTIPRAQILNIFQRSNGHSHLRHLGAEEVHQILLTEKQEVGIATVYRVLLQFEQAGILRRSALDSQRAVYELNDGEHHDHIQCLDCGHVEEFVDAQIEQRQHDVAQALGFKLQEHVLSLYAHCTKENCDHKLKK